MRRSWSQHLRGATGILIICTIATTLSITVSNVNPPKVNITSESHYFLEGETFSLNCTVNYQTNLPVELTWHVKERNNKSKDLVSIKTNENETTGGILYKHIMILNATEEDAGEYVCSCRNGNSVRNESYIKRYAGKEGFLNISQSSLYLNKPIETMQDSTKLHTRIIAYPPAKFKFYKDNIVLPMDGPKYKVLPALGAVDLKISNLNIFDTGNYTVVASNKYVDKSVTYDLRRKDTPKVNIIPHDIKTCEFNSVSSLMCEVIGYPLPNITWFYNNQNDEIVPLVGENHQKSIIKSVSTLKINCRTAENITCYAENKLGKASRTTKLVVYEVPGGFGVKNKKTWFPQGQDVNMKCYASKYEYRNVTWYKDDSEFETVSFDENSFSYISTMKIYNVMLDDAGNYTCVGFKRDDTEESPRDPDIDSFVINVAERREPIITEPVQESTIEFIPYQPIHLRCQGIAIPPPQITWEKDGEMLSNISDIIYIITEPIDEVETIVNSTLSINNMLEDREGKYECVVTSQGITERRIYNLQLIDKATTHRTTYLIITGALVFLLFILVVYLAWKIRKEKQFRKELAAAGLLYFKEGVPKSLNPDLAIDEQAELLPYDDKFEFPYEKLSIGKQLGAGAFGVVYKAEARGIINAEEVTPVAVKMVKKTADNMYIRALATELKIMVHLGKHVNIVNLLGACTKNVGKRELVVIVEYCKFGNIHNYMQRHREVFIDTLSTDVKENNFGNVNRAFSSTSGSSGMHSDYFGSTHTQETDHTFVNTVNTNRSGRKVSETGYVQPDWRSNYESDYSFDGRNPRPLTSRDLLAWAFQIARGMEYLASRKVLHGDLAARNVLLAEDNIVKICDFGLARSIYKNDEYKKQENSPLPIKWLAIECMTDRIFSTQSDVWSFGVVLWELFSLAKTPYPNVSPTGFLQWLNKGNRLEKPQYANDRLYKVMLDCWKQKPTERPNFSQLQETLGSYLEDNVRNHYVDLNNVYMDVNMKQEGQEDYLAMVCAPDYNNLVTPSPHHYVNDVHSFFPPTPTQLQHDDEGYLQMSPAKSSSIYSPRGTSNKFDFDTRKINLKMTEPNSHGSELTPMLTLNNLPSKSGSESDHDGNSLPYLKMCPRIDEETDDVFEMKQYNFKNDLLNQSDTQNSAVTNPTYIKFDVEKKPQNISNNYINVPNGLVK